MIFQVQELFQQNSEVLTQNASNTFPTVPYSSQAESSPMFDEFYLAILRKTPEEYDTIP